MISALLHRQRLCQSIRNPMESTCGRTVVPLPGMLSVPENRLQNVGKKQSIKAQDPGERLKHSPGPLFYCRVSFVCRRRRASSFTSSMTTAVSGIKKMMPMMPKSFPPIMAATRVYSGESPTDFPTTRG